MDIDLRGRARTDLLGHSILLIEDDFHQARDTRQALQHSGARVFGPVKDPDAAIRLINDRQFSCAIVDINLGAGASFDIATSLQEKGVPFLFMTGLDPASIPARLGDAPVIRKPVEFRALLKAAAQISSNRWR